MKKYVYLIQSVVDDRNLFKIGISKKEPSKRLKQLQTGNPYKLVLIDSFLSNYANILESSLHRHYNIVNVINEWFELCDDDVENFTYLCNKYESNFDSLNENIHFKKL